MAVVRSTCGGREKSVDDVFLPSLLCLLIFDHAFLFLVVTLWTLDVSGAARHHDARRGAVHARSVDGGLSPRGGASLACGPAGDAAFRASAPRPGRRGGAAGEAGEAGRWRRKGATRIGSPGTAGRSREGRGSRARAWGSWRAWRSRKPRSTSPVATCGVLELDRLPQ